jgi:hypothetical protein
MRDIIIKASMIAGAALLVTACGGETATNNTSANTMGGEYNTMDTMGNVGDMNTMGTTMDSNTSMDGNMAGNISVNTTTGNVSGNVSTNGM